MKKETKTDVKNLKDPVSIAAGKKHIKVVMRAAKVRERK